jgi:hypothetical protein
MVKTIGQNPMAIRRLEHHSGGYLPIRDALTNEILFGWIGQDNDLHILRQGRTGVGSFSLELARGHAYHFRPAGPAYAPGSVAIMSSARKGNLLTVLTGTDQARHWIRSLKGNRMAVAVSSP